MNVNVPYNMYQYNLSGNNMYQYNLSGEKN